MVPCQSLGLRSDQLFDVIHSNVWGHVKFILSLDTDGLLLLLMVLVGILLWLETRYLYG